MQLIEDMNYHPDIDTLAGLITDKTRLIIPQLPGEPLRLGLSPEEMVRIADLVKQHPGLYVMADEIYKDILYTGEHYSIASLPGMEERTIILDGFSKSYAMTGWRLGYGILPEELVPHVVKLAVNSVSCAATFTQKAGIAALEGPRDQVVEMVAEFEARRRLITDGPAQHPRHKLPRTRRGVLCLPQRPRHRTQQPRVRGPGDGRGWRGAAIR